MIINQPVCRWTGDPLAVLGDIVEHRAHMLRGYNKDWLDPVQIWRGSQIEPERRLEPTFSGDGLDLRLLTLPVLVVRYVRANANHIDAFAAFQLLDTLC